MFIEIEGINIFYEVDGEGETVVLMHGWGGNTESFKPLFDYLSKKHKVYVFDFPGFGKSNIPLTVWGAHDYADFTIKFFEAVNIKKAHLIAHSFGGRVAILIAAKHPEIVNKLVLVDSAGIKPKRTIKYYIKIIIAKTGKRLFSLPIFGKYGDLLLNKLYGIVGSKDYQNAGIMRNILVKVVNEDLRMLLSQINAPTLLVWGENDKDVPLSYAKLMEKEIKNAGLVVLKDAGHFSYLDRFPQFCRVISSFFERKKEGQN